MADDRAAATGFGGRPATGSSPAAGEPVSGLGGGATGGTGRHGAGTGAGGNGAGGGAGKDWAAETADRIDRLVTTVRTQTTDRLLSVARLLVYGLLAAIMGLMALVLVVVALVRALDELIPQEVWLTYLVVGAIFVLAGLFLWSKRAPRPSKAEAKAKA